MKFSLGAAAALAGCATALQPADVYIMSQSPESTSQLGRSVANLIFLQRLSSKADTGSLKDFPEDALEAAIGNINTFGKQPQALFQDATQQPSQLLIMLEGITAENREALDKALNKINPAFQVTDAPSSAAHRDLAQKDLAAAGVAQTKCTLERAISPFEEECWSGKSSVALYDVQKDPSIAQTLADNISRLIQLASAGEMDTTLLLIPESTRASTFDSWSSSPLRRRQVEEVMTEVDEPAPTNPSSSLNGPFVVSAKGSAIPACFNSQSSCETATGNCSSHGKCQNKYPNAAEDQACFRCQCGASVEGDGRKQHTQWAGATCSKKDVSVPFWLITGLLLSLLGVLSFSVTLLFNVGEEKLPGVIGAGVSRSK